MVLQKTPQIVVLLAAYNGTRWIAAQIDSILAQQAVAVQVVLSIDRSSDGTEAWAAQLAQRDARVSVLPGGRFLAAQHPIFFACYVMWTWPVVTMWPWLIRTTCGTPTNWPEPASSCN